MTKKKSKYDAGPPYGHNDRITCYYELDFGKDVIKPGDKIRFKNARGFYVFKKWVHNFELDVQWIDVIDPSTSEYKSFYMERLKGVHRAKKSIRKKLV